MRKIFIIPLFLIIFLLLIKYIIIQNNQNSQFNLASHHKHTSNQSLNNKFGKTIEKLSEILTLEEVNKNKYIKYYHLREAEDQSGINLVAWGWTLFENGYIEQAKQITENALYQDTLNLEALVNLGLIYKEMNMLSDFSEICQMVLNKHPENIEIYQTISDFYIEHSNIDAALETLYKGVEFNSDDPNFRFLLGDTLMVLGNYQDAANIYISGLEIDENNYGAYFNLGLIYNHMEERDLANDAFIKAKQM